MVKSVVNLVSPLGAWRPLAPRGAGLTPPSRPGRRAAQVAPAGGLLRRGPRGGFRASSFALGVAAAVPWRRGPVLSPCRAEGRAARWTSPPRREGMERACWAARGAPGLWEKLGRTGAPPQAAVEPT